MIPIGHFNFLDNNSLVTNETFLSSKLSSKFCPVCIGHVYVHVQMPCLDFGTQKTWSPPRLARSAQCDKMSGLAFPPMRPDVLKNPEWGRCFGNSTTAKSGNSIECATVANSLNSAWKKIWIFPNYLGKFSDNFHRYVGGVNDTPHSIEFPDFAMRKRPLSSQKNRDLRAGGPSDPQSRNSSAPLRP